MQDASLSLTPILVAELRSKKQRLYIADRVVKGIVHKCCTRCGHWKTHDQFNSNGDRLRSSCRMCKGAVDHQYRQENVEKCKEGQKRHYAANSVRRRASAKSHYQRNLDHHRKYQRRYKQKNKEERNRKNRERFQTDLTYRLECAMRTGVRSALAHRGIKKNARCITLVGCSTEHLRNHLEAMFQPGMTWENRGTYRVGQPMTWHIDHIRPCASFDLSDPQQQLECFNWRNLQPLWAIDNVRKSDSRNYFGDYQI